MLNKTSKNLRLHSLIGSYIELTKGAPELPNTAEAYREIYDKITSGEIKESELPDVEIFRKVSIMCTIKEKKKYTGEFIQKKL